MLNTKDIISGGLLVGLALFGLFINGGMPFGLTLDMHPLGTPRRMGPGYLPMLTLWVLFGLGLAVLLIGLRNGPDPLARWTGMDTATAALAPIALVATMVLLQVAFPEREGHPGIEQNLVLGLSLLAGFIVMAISKGWRLFGWVLIAMTMFGLLLDVLGLVATVAITVVLSSLADETQKPVGVIGCAIGLCALSYAVFIYGLDIRVPVWPQF